MKTLFTLIAVLALAAPFAMAQIDAETQARIDKVRAERGVQVNQRYLEEIKGAKGNVKAINDVQNRYQPLYDTKGVGSDPRLPAEQMLKLRKQELLGKTEEVSETEAEVSASTVTNWSDDVARDYAIENFREDDPKTMKMMMDARRKELDEALKHR